MLLKRFSASWLFQSFLCPQKYLAQVCAAHWKACFQDMAVVEQRRRLDRNSYWNNCSQCFCSVYFLRCRTLYRGEINFVGFSWTRTRTRYVNARPFAAKMMFWSVACVYLDRHLVQCLYQPVIYTNKPAFRPLMWHTQERLKWVEFKQRIKRMFCPNSGSLSVTCTSARHAQIFYEWLVDQSI